MTAPVYAYLRVSTAGQADGFGLEAQSTGALDYATAHNLDITDTFTDVCSGTVPGVGRTGFANLLTAVSLAARPPTPGASESDATVPSGRRGTDDGVSGRQTLRSNPTGSLPACERAPVVILPRLDRLARDLLVSEGCLAALWQAGAVVVDASTGQAVDRDSPTDPTRTLIRQVLGAVAQYDRAAITARMAAGRRAKAAAGGYATGRPSYGWRAQGGELVPDEHEQAGLARARHLRSTGCSLRLTATILDREGYPPKAGPGHAWQAKTLAGVLGRTQSTGRVRS